jgi:hypothetical protein
MKKVLLAGVLGGLLMMTWLVVFDGMMGFRRDITMKGLDDEREVYGFLARHVTELGAWLLAYASEGVRRRYATRVGFFVLIGLVAVIMGFGARFGLAAYGMGDALALAGDDLAAWVLAGLVVGALVGGKPRRNPALATGSDAHG